MRRVILSAVLVLLSILSNQVKATALMAIWNFGEDRDHYTLGPIYEYVIGTPGLSASGAEYDADGKNGVSFMVEAGNFHPSGQAVGWDDVSGADSDAEWIMIINTTGWQDMKIRWDYLSDATGGNQGPTSFDLDYRIGSGDWVEILPNELIIRDDAWHEFSYDLSSLPVIENQSSVSFRVNDLDQGDLNGDYKFDNLQLTGVPEPGSIIFLIFGGLALIRKSKRTNTYFK